MGQSHCPWHDCDLLCFAGFLDCISVRQTKKSPIPEIGQLLAFATSLNFTEADIAKVHQLHADYMRELNRITCEPALPFYRRFLRYFRNSS
jgi:hypothetical protein